MSIVKEAFMGGLSYAVLKFANQLVSWGTTIYVARILSSRDYGIMSMATILTGFVQMFLEMGIGSALVQRKNVNDDEISSLFWVTIVWGVFLNGLCFLLAYPTVKIFNEPALLPVTQAASLLFFINAAAIIPRSLLIREIKFFQLGLIEISASMVSSIAMVIIAYRGGGVWTLIGSVLIKDALQLVFLWGSVGWRPRRYWNAQAVRPFVKFGLFLAGSSSVAYINDRMDSYFGAKALGSFVFGYYSLAMNLAVAPVQKIVSIFNTIAFPVFSKLQDDSEEYNKFYLRLINTISMLVFPVFIGGIWMADDLIPALLGDKWIPAIIPFRLLCIYQMVFSISIPNRLVHTSQNRPQWSLYFLLANMPLLLVSFWISASYKSLALLAVPWVTVYLITEFVFLLLTLRKLKIEFSKYIRVIVHPTISSLIMLAFLYLSSNFFMKYFNAYGSNRGVRITISAVLIIIIYGGYYLVFQREILKSFWRMRNGRKNAGTGDTK